MCCVCPQVTPFLVRNILHAVFLLRLSLLVNLFAKFHEPELLVVFCL